MPRLGTASPCATRPPGASWRPRHAHPIRTLALSGKTNRPQPNNSFCDRNKRRKEPPLITDVGGELVNTRQSLCDASTKPFMTTPTYCLLCVLLCFSTWWMGGWVSGWGVVRAAPVHSGTHALASLFGPSRTTNTC